MRISDWSSDVCSSDLAERRGEIMVHSRKLYRRSNDSCSRPEPSVRYCNQKDQAGQMLALKSLEQPHARRQTPSEKRRVGKGCVSSHSYMRATEHLNKKKTTPQSIIK